MKTITNKGPSGGVILDMGDDVRVLVEYGDSVEVSDAVAANLLATGDWIKAKAAKADAEKTTPAAAGDED